MREALTLGAVSRARKVRVIAKRKVQVATYEFSLDSGLTTKIPGYRVEIDVGLFDVVEKKALGRVALAGSSADPDGPQA